MSSCADFSCICSPSGSCVFATSASWPTADAPLRYRSAFSYSLRHQRRRPVKTVQPPMVRKIFGAVLNVLAPWSSSNGSLPLKSSSVLHLFRSALPHENTIDITNVLGVSAPAALPRLLGQQSLLPASHGHPRSANLPLLRPFRFLYRPLCSVAQIQPTSAPLLLSIQSP